MGRSEGQVTTMRSPHWFDMDRLRLSSPVTLRCNNKLRKWAYDNAYMLIVMGVMFAITWAAIFYLGVKNSVS